MYVGSNRNEDSPGGERAIVKNRRIADDVPAVLDIEDALVIGGAADQPALAKRRFSLGSLLRFKWTLVAVFGLVAVPSVVAIWLLVEPQYEARAKIRVRPIIPRLVFATDENGQIPFYDNFLNTQVLIIRSPGTLNKVLDEAEVRATQWYADPDTLLGRAKSPMERLLESLKVRPVPRTEIVDLRFQTSNPKEARLVLGKVLEHYISRTMERARDIEKDLMDDLRAEYGALKAEVEAAEKAVTATKTKEQLETSAPDELVSAMRLRVEEAEASLAALEQQIKVLRRHRDELRAVQRERFAVRVSRLDEPTLMAMAVDLAKRIESLRERRGEVQAKRREYASGSEAADADLTDLRIQVLDRELAELKWREEELSKCLPGGKLPDAAVLATSTSAPADSLAGNVQFNNDTEWRRLKRAVTIAEHKLGAAGQNLKDRHPTVLGLRKELDLVQRMLEEREKELLDLNEAGATALAGTPSAPSGQSNVGVGAGEDLESRLARIQLELSALMYREPLEKTYVNAERDKIKDVLSGSQKLQEEMRELARKRELLKAVDDRKEQREIEGKGNNPGSISVLSQAFAPGSPAKDRRLVFTAMAVFGALGLATGAAYLRSSRSQAMHTVEELPWPLRTPFLGQLPAVAGADEPEQSAILLEGIRMVRTALLSRVDRVRGGHAVLVTSAGTGTGKSTVVRLLGRSLADCGKSVLLVDGDIRKPSLTRTFDLLGKPGLLDELRRERANGNTIHATDNPHLSVMPIGTAESGGGIELMANGTMASRLDDLRGSYDFILFDGAPILPVADSRIISQHVDGTIMVVREDRCRRSEVVDALAYLGFSGGKLLGTVYIGTDQRTQYYSDYYRSGNDRA